MDNMQIPPPGSSPRSTSPTPSSSPEGSPSSSLLATNNTLSRSPFSEENLPKDLTQIDCDTEDYAYEIAQKHEAGRLQQLTTEEIYSNLDEAKLRKGMDVLISSLSTCGSTLTGFEDQFQSLGLIHGQLLNQNLSKESFDELIAETTKIIEKLLDGKQEQDRNVLEEAIDLCINSLIDIFISQKFSLPSELIKVSLDFINQKEKKTQLIDKFFLKNSIKNHVCTILLAIERKFYPPKNNTETLDDRLEDLITNAPISDLTNLIGQLEFCIILLALEESSQTTGTTAFQSQILGVIKNSLRNSNIIRLANTKSARNIGEIKNDTPENTQISPIQDLIKRLFDLKADDTGNYIIDAALKFVIKNTIKEHSTYPEVLKKLKAQNAPDKLIETIQNLISEDPTAPSEATPLQIIEEQPLNETTDSETSKEESAPPSS